VTVAQNSIDSAIQAQDWLDRLAKPVQQSVKAVLRPDQAGSPLRNLLHGTFLGHPLHPVLTDVPIGGYTVGLVLDLLSYLPLGRRFAPGADAAIALGLVGVLPTAAAGLADWSHTSGQARRVGLVHALANVTGTLLYSGSLLFRSKGNRGLGRGLGLLGYGVVSFGAYLGGELVYRHGLGTAPTAFERATDEWQDVGEESAIAAGEIRKVDVGGAPVLLARVSSGQFGAISDTCTHMGCSLSEGRLKDAVITCPCHGSRFDVHTGSALLGPASVPSPRYDVTVLAGRIKLRPASPR
jgi:nitrite reductase/ring-hydroxylating ferredoxin subunit/uncharacterized membrane protein